MSTETVVGVPAWDRAWALPLWWQSLRANVDPSTTGLIFVVPGNDESTRDAILDGLGGRHDINDFAWVDVIRDRGKQFGREERMGDRHRSLARARNTILQLIEKARPRHYLSWDSDFLVPPGTVDLLRSHDNPLETVWAWLNRQPPKPTLFEGKKVYWQSPVRATAMRWDPRSERHALHYPSKQFNQRAQGIWQCGVALAFQLMDERAYRVASYAPHHDGEDIPFNWQLHQRRIPRYCCGEVLGVHLYDRGAENEIKLGWPGILNLAQQRPLATLRRDDRSSTLEALGLFPALESDGSVVAA